MIYTYSATGGIAISAEAEVLSEYYSYVADGSVFVDDTSLYSIVTYSEFADGNVSIGDIGLYDIISYSEFAYGSVVVFGDSYESNAYKPSGTIYVSGNSNSFIRYTINVSGDILVSYQPSAITTFNVDFVYSFNYSVYQTLESSYSFSYNVGDTPFYVFRVTGKEYYNCNSIPFCAIPNGLNRMFQEVIARNLKEVCQFLTDVKWTWPIASIQRSLHPVESFVAIGSTGIAINGLPVPTSNSFIPISYNQIPECLELSIDPSPITYLGISSYALEIFTPILSGTISVNGSAIATSEYLSFGTITISGTSECASSNFNYVSSGYSLISSEAEFIYSYRSFESSGQIIVDNEFIVQSPFYSYYGNGSISANDNAVVNLKLSFVSSGYSTIYPSYAGIVIYGDAEYPILQIGSGIIYIGGEAEYATIYLNEIGFGNVTLGAESIFVSPYQYYDGSGYIIIDNSILINIASYVYESDASTGITIDGISTTRDSLAGDFWYTTILDSLLVNGNSDDKINGLSYYSLGDGIQISGFVESPLLWAPISPIRIINVTEETALEVEFQEIASPPATPLLKVLYLKNNMKDICVLKDFLKINKLSLPSLMALTATRNTDRTGDDSLYFSTKWSVAYHYEGLGSRNFYEYWSVIFTIYCFSDPEGNILNEEGLKFECFISKTEPLAKYLQPTNTELCNPKKVSSSYTFNFLVPIPCVAYENDGFNMKIEIDFIEQIVTVNDDMVLDNIKVHDVENIFGCGDYGPNDWPGGVNLSYAFGNGNNVGDGCDEPNPDGTVGPNVVGNDLNDYNTDVPKHKGCKGKMSLEVCSGLPPPSQSNVQDQSNLCNLPPPQFYGATLPEQRGEVE